MDVGEADVASAKAVGQALVIQAQKVKDGGVQVVHRGDIFHGVLPISSVVPYRVPPLMPPPAIQMVKAVSR